jgi:hypothetical protein
LQVHPDLRRGQTSAVGRHHRLLQVHHQLVQLGRVEAGDGLGVAQQARIAHFQDGVDGHGLDKRPGWV